MIFRVYSVELLRDFQGLFGRAPLYIPFAGLGLDLLIGDGNGVVFGRMEVLKARTEAPFC